MDIKSLCDSAFLTKKENELQEQVKFTFGNLCKTIQNENVFQPRVLYKYMDVEGACKFIENLSIKYTDPYEFDDIFELTEFLNLKDNNTAREDKRTHLLKSIKKSTEVFELLKQLKKQIGVACYSTEWNINIMWSLYAGKHTGVVFGLTLCTFFTFFKSVSDGNAGLKKYFGCVCNFFPPSLFRNL